MVGIINLFLPLFIQVLILYFLSRLLNRIILKRLGRTWYLATMWPGVVVHELSHLLGCLLTFTKVSRVHLFHPTEDSLGFVEHERVHNPLTTIVISVAPLFGVTTVMWLITRWLWPDLYQTSVGAVQAALADFRTFQDFFNFTLDYFQRYWTYLRELVAGFNLDAWQTYLFVYLMLTLSSHAAPSKEDLQHAYYGIVCLIAVFVLIYYLDQWLQVPLTWTAIRWLATPVFLAANFLAYGIIFAGLSLLIMSLVALVFRVFKRGIPY